MIKKISECTIPFFQGNFGEILTFWPKMSDFCDAHFERVDLFSFLPFFYTIYGEQSKCMLLFEKIKILEKKGTKRVKYRFWSHMGKNFCPCVTKIDILPFLYPFFLKFLFFRKVTYIYFVPHKQYKKRVKRKKGPHAQSERHKNRTFWAKMSKFHQNCPKKRVSYILISFLS